MRLLWVPFPEHGPPRINTTQGNFLSAVVLKKCFKIRMFLFILPFQSLIMIQILFITNNSIQCKSCQVLWSHIFCIYVAIITLYFVYFISDLQILVNNELCGLQQIQQMPKLQLSQILGNSSQNAQQIAFAQDCLLYISGSFIISYNPIVDQQICYLQHCSPLISCMTVSKCQKYLAICSTPLQKDRQKQKTLESIGKKSHSNITIYNLGQIGVQQPKVMIVLKGHKYAIEYGLFSSDGKYFVSVCNRDGSMFVWDLRNGDRITQNKNSKNINCIKFMQNASNPQQPVSLVTVSRGMCKVWQFYQSQNMPILSKTKQQQQYILTGRTLQLSKKLATKQFMDINFYNNYILLLTADGLLCLVSTANAQHKQQKLQKCIDLMISKISSMDVFNSYVICGGENAVVKVIDLDTLTLVRKFPKPPPVRKENIEKDSQNCEDMKQESYNQGDQFPYCTCVKTIGSNKFSQFIVTIYQNMTLFVWRPQPTQMLAMRSIISHQGPISKIQILEQLQNNLTFFSTIGSDNTIRIWHIYNRCIYNRQSIDIAKLIGIKRNAYCRNLTRIIYIDGEKSKGLCMCVCGSQGGYVGVGAGTELLLYQLAGFEIWGYQALDAQAVAVSIVDGIVYVGLGNGKVVMYEIVQKQGRLHKIRQIQLNNGIKSMHVLQNKPQLYLAILTQQSQQLLIYDLNKSKLTHIQKPIKHICPTSNSPTLLTANSHSLSIFNPSKQKQTYLLSLKHELTQNQHIIKIITNSLWIVILTNNNRLIVANYSPAIVLTKQFTQNINDIQVSQCGQFIIVGEYGNIAIWNMHGLETYGAVEDQMKKWVNRDMSWMDGSVWANRKSSNIEGGAQSKLPGDIVDSIRLKSSVGRDSIRLELPNMDIKYKTQQNDQSVFNPSHILKQAKEIYKNIDVIEKKINNNSNFCNQKETQKAEKMEKVEKGQKSEKPKGKGGPIQFQMEQDESLQQIKMSRNKIRGKPPTQDTFGGKGNKRKIFGLKVTQNKDQQQLSKELSQQAQQGLPEQFRNNLVSSIIHQIDKDQPHPKQCEKNTKNNYSQFSQQKKQTNQKKQEVRQAGQISNLYEKSNYDILKEKQMLFQLAQKLEKNQEFILNHAEQIEKIYAILGAKIGTKNKNTSIILDRDAVLNQFNKLSKQFVKFLAMPQQRKN